jgi:DNA helicase HerA-like ATPase
VEGDESTNGGEDRIGRIIAVSASRATLALDRQSLAPLEMGSVVKMPTRMGTVYAMVSRLDVAGPGLEPSDRDLKTAEIEFVGEVGKQGGDDSFQRGASAYPVLDQAASLASPADLQKIYARPEAATAQVGAIHQDAGVAAYILIDELLSKHFSIVGSTGSGKSCLVTAILGAVLDQAPNAHIILLDPHSEYANAFGKRAAVLSPGDGLYFPYWLFNLDELAEVVLGPECQPDQVKILGEAVLAAKQTYFAKTGLNRHGTVDTPAPYRIADVLYFIDVAMGALNPPESLSAYRTVSARIAALQSDARYAFVFNTRMTLRDELCDILARLFRIPVAGKPITILDLEGVPSEVVNVIVSVLCRLAFDFAVWSETQVPITFVCEEAHRYAPRDKVSGFEGAKRALFRVAKEGRKYGVSLCVVSQRPSDLAPGLLAECGTIFTFRMTDQEDQVIVRSAAPESCYGLLNFLPALRTAETIAIGEGVSLPMRICLASLPADRRPKSATASFTAAWIKETDGKQIEETVERWRRGIRPSPG